MKTLLLTVYSFTLTSLSHCFSLLSAFCILSHFEIIDCYFNIFFAEIKLTKENLKSVFWAPEFGCPKKYIGLPNSLNTSLSYIICGSAAEPSHSSTISSSFCSTIFCSSTKLLIKALTYTNFHLKSILKTTKNYFVCSTMHFVKI